MVNYWTADQHFGHDKILEYCRRPFKNTQRATREKVKRHNSVVGEDDTVWHLGDIAMAGADRATYVEHLLRRLNGTHILILGNHDQIAAMKFVDIGFRSVHTSFEMEIEGYKVVMAHDPSIWNVISNMDPLPIFLHGHIHNLWKSIKDKRIVNVGVDVWDFYPVSFKQILEELGL